jgi:hypothetical protein
MKYFWVLLLLMFKLPAVEGQTRRALIVGIGAYPDESGWNKIHGDNDVPLIKIALTHKGFITKNINCLTNENATKTNIIKSFNQLVKQAKINDFIYIHFSTHGQQVTDINGDEADGLDEAIIPYDACKTYVKGKYEGKNHLIDDELNRYLTAIRQKIGKSGTLLVVIDACHSGDASRGNSNENDTLMIRGSADVFQTGIKKKYVPKPEKTLDWVVISATQSYQNNYEYLLNGEYFGSLSYAIKLSLSDSTGKEDFLSFFNTIKSKREEMNVVRYPQRPMIDGESYYQKQKAF